VDILILFPNKIFLTIFWLKIWWDVAKHPNSLHLFCKFGEVGGCWLAQKWHEPQNNPKFRGFCPLGPSAKELSTF